MKRPQRCHVPGYREHASRWIVNFRSHRVRASRDEHSPIVKQSRGMETAWEVGASRGGEDSGCGIVDFGSLRRCSTYNQYLAVGKQRGSMSIPVRIHVAC